MERKDIVAYYSRDDVAAAIAGFARNREMVGRFADGGYSSRPGTLLYPGDVKQMAQNGIVSFHASVELWENPMQLENSERMGWDFLIDLDADELDNARKVAEVLLELLRAHGVESVSLKFSGRSGFHIYIPWEAFDGSLAGRFPEIPRAIGLYLEDHLQGMTDELTKEQRHGVEIDSIAISPRHLVRAPYSLNEKVWLASIPVEDPWFDLEKARPDNVEVEEFRLSAEPGEAMSLVDLSLEFLQRKRRHKRKPKKRMKLKNKIPEQFFAPCMEKIMGGLSDGRKRAEFIIRTYLRNIGWEWDEIEELLFKWNKRNKPPLREGYLQSQLRWHKRQDKKILPPNHQSAGFYKDMGVLTEECRRWKNPLSYTFAKYRTYVKYHKGEEGADEKDGGGDGGST